MSTFTRASTFILGPEGDAAHILKSPFKKVITPSRIPQLQLSKHHLMFQVRKIPRPSSRRIGTAAKPSESSTSSTNSARLSNASFRIKTSRQCYAGRMRRVSQEQRMQKLEEIMLKQKNFPLWKAVVVIAMIFLLAMIVITCIELGWLDLLLRRYSVSKMLRIIKDMTVQKREVKMANGPLMKSMIKKVRGWIATIVWEIKSKLAMDSIDSMNELVHNFIFSSSRFLVYAQLKPSHT